MNLTQIYLNYSIQDSVLYYCNSMQVLRPHVFVVCFFYFNIFYINYSNWLYITCNLLLILCECVTSKKKPARFWDERKRQREVNRNYATCHTVPWNSSPLRNDAGVCGACRQTWTRPCRLMIVALMTSLHTHVRSHRVTISPSNSRTRRKMHRDDASHCQLWMISASNTSRTSRARNAGG